MLLLGTQRKWEALRKLDTTDQLYTRQEAYRGTTQ